VQPTPQTKDGELFRKLTPIAPRTLSPEERKRYDERRARLSKILEPVSRACRESEMLTAADMMFTVNCKGEPPSDAA
jgi:hypothetical protein